MNKILWFINESAIDITYKNRAKAVLKKIPFNNNATSKYLLKSKSNEHIGYAYIFKEKMLLNKSDQYNSLKELITKGIEETNINAFALLGVEPMMAAYTLNDFKNQFISGIELMCEVFISALNGLLHKNRICLVIDRYVGLLNYGKIFELFGEISILCENYETIEEYVRIIYENTATSIYITKNPAILKQADIVFYGSANKNYVNYLNANNIVLDLLDIIDEYYDAKLIKPPAFMDFYNDRISGILINNMIINTSCAQSLLYALNMDFIEYSKEIKLI